MSHSVLLLAAIQDCPEVTPRLRLAAAAFAVGLIVLLPASTWAMRFWRRHVGEASDTAQRVVHNSAIPLALQMLIRAIDMGVVVVLYRTLCISTIGGYEFAALLVVMYLGAFADFGLTVITTREVARDPAAAPRYFRAMVRLRSLLGLAAVPLAFGVAATYSLIGAPLDQEIWLLIGILVLTLLPAGYAASVTAVFHGHERLQDTAHLNLVTNIVSALLRIGALALGFGIIGVAVASLLATIFTATLFAVALRRTFGRIPLRGPALPGRSLLAEGWPLMLNSLLMSVFFRFDNFIIQAWLGSVAVAAYGVTYKYISLTQILPPIVVNALFPLLTRRADVDRAAFRHAYHYTLRLLLLLSLPMATAMSLLAEPLVWLLADETVSDYSMSIPALAIIVWYLPFAYVNGLTQYALIALGRQRIITAAFGLTAAFNLLANIILIPIWGIAAAAAVTIASELVLFLPLRWALKRTTGAPPLLAMAWRPALASLLLAAGLLAFREVNVLLALLIATLLYGAALLALGTFTAEDRLLLRRVLSRVRLDQA